MIIHARRYDIKKVLVNEINRMAIVCYFKIIVLMTDVNLTQIGSNITDGSVSSMQPVSLENRLTIRPNKLVKEKRSI